MGRKTDARLAPADGLSDRTDDVPDDRFLVIRLSAVGDVVNTLPAVALLRSARPEAWIGFAVEDRAEDLIVDHPLVDRAHVFPRRRWRQWLSRPGQWGALRADVARYRQELLAEGYEVALDVQGNTKGAIHALASGARRRIGFARGYDREGNHFFSTEQVVPPSDRPHRVDKFASLLGPLGIEGNDRRWVFPRAPEAERVVGAFAASIGLVGGGYVALHPGTSGRGVAKRWPVDRFAALASRIARELGCDVVVTWGPGEEKLARTVAQGAERVHVGPRTSSLLELLALVRDARLFVSADTGPMHMAAASGTRCLALFGPKDPRVYAPYGDGHTVIHRPGGMEEISVAEVFEAAAAMSRDG